MKRLVTSLAILVLGLSISGCSKEAAKEPETALTSPKDEIIVYVGGTIFDTSLDPVKGAMSYGYGFTNCALLRVNENSEYEGDMAEDWNVSDDALRYTFNLKKDIKFSDGSDFTAEDVVFTYNQVKNNQAENENVDLTRLENVTALDDFTVEFTLAEAYSPFIDTVSCLGIVPSDSYDTTVFDKYPVGTGAWKVIQYDPNQQIIVEANENYYEGTPEIKKVTIVYMDSEAAFSNAKSGQLDVVMVDSSYTSENIDKMHVEKLETMDIRMISLPVLDEHIVKNAKGEDVEVGNNVTADINVRKALSIGIDRQNAINDAFNGIGKPAVSFTSNLNWAYSQKVEDNKKDEAREILESAGWTDSDNDGVREKDGIKCEFDVYTPTNDNDRFLLAHAVAQEAKELGIKINIKTGSWDEILKIQGHSGVLWGWGQYSPTVIYSLFSSNLFLSGAYDNVIGYSNPEVDKEIEKAFSSEDYNEVISSWKKVQEIANKDYGYLYIANIEHSYFVSDDLDISVETQIAHPHGHGAPVLCNLKDWKIKK